jgi:GDP-L-fucose synthase
MSQKVLIAGQEGMVGSAVYKLFKKKKFKIIDCKRKDLDFTSQKIVDKWFKKNKPDLVINAAGRVGGILDNYKFQSDYLYINTMIGMNIVNSSFKHNVKRLINLGSSCIYPKVVKQPISENSLLSSSLEKTNEGYALSKIVTLKYCQYLKQKYKKNFISIQPANLYGIGDNFDLKSSHVLPALVKKFVLAKTNNKKTVEVWGTGKVRREFLNVEDLAEAIYFLTKKKINNS